MAGMFYSLQEVAEKLNKTEEEVNEMVRDGRLREFRDGPNLLFKVDEVEALMSDTSFMASKETSAEKEQQIDEDEVSLAPETDDGSTVGGGELADADTAMAGEGINVLEEADSDYQLADDTLGETKATSGEASLEEIEEDVNLDTFGSGSGLLDLSLQADDTSLGGILDEIYTAEGKEGQDAGGPGSAMEVAADAEQMLAEEELAAPQPHLGASAIAQAYVEPEPDTLSNAFGYMLFLPLLAIIYTTIVTAAGQRGAMPAILGKIQGIIWYIVGGGIVAAFAIIGVAFMLSSNSDKPAKKPRAKKAKKTKKVKS